MLRLLYEAAMSDLKRVALDTPERRALLAQFLRFGTVGAMGFCLDTALVYGLRRWLGLYGAGIASYFVTASVNWAANRSWTFHTARRDGWHAQWARFLAANSAGFVLNRGTYVLLVALSPLCRRAPVIAVAAGAVAGMFANFHLSRKHVFR